LNCGLIIQKQRLKFGIIYTSFIQGVNLSDWIVIYFDQKILKESHH